MYKDSHDVLHLLLCNKAYFPFANTLFLQECEHRMKDFVSELLIVRY